jgi:hypothetical protein
MVIMNKPIAVHAVQECEWQRQKEQSDESSNLMAYTSGSGVLRMRSHALMWSISAALPRSTCIKANRSIAVAGFT